MLLSVCQTAGSAQCLAEAGAGGGGGHAYWRCVLVGELWPSYGAAGGDEQATWHQASQALVRLLWWGRLEAYDFCQQMSLDNCYHLKKVWRSGEFSVDWRKTNIISIFKKG